MSATEFEDLGGDGPAERSRASWTASANPKTAAIVHSRRHRRYNATPNARGASRTATVVLSAVTTTTTHRSVVSVIDSCRDKIAQKVATRSGQPKLAMFAVVSRYPAGSSATIAAASKRSA